MPAPPEGHHDADVLESEVVVIGAGVVGLAVAARLARDGRSVIVLERERGTGRITSSRNSGVLHAGIYYPPGSLKAETCVRGRRLLYERAERLGIDHRKTGKLIVAVDSSSPWRSRRSPDSSGSMRAPRRPA